jgi:branched-chain amino acid transport system ATP-binding protein
MSAILTATNLSTGYGDLRAVSGLNLEIGTGEVVALLGPNGAGKTSSLLALVGYLPLMEGEIRWRGQPIAKTMSARTRHGISFVGEDRSIFRSLSVRDNLRLGGAAAGQAVEYFPELAPLLDRRAGLCSGGEQQMLTVGRALSRGSALVIIDELSLGLAPQVADRLANIVRDAARGGVGALVVEQDIDRAIWMADRVLVLNHGVTTFSSDTEALRADASPLLSAFFSQTGGVPAAVVEEGQLESVSVDHPQPSGEPPEG